MTIAIENIGKISSFSFEPPDEGGVILLEGDNGIGKTTVLHTVECLTGGSKTVPEGKKDGTPGGTAAGFGRTIKVKKKTMHSGDLEIEGLGDLDIVHLHTPKFATPVTRDKARIAALVKLTGVEPSIDLFAGLTANPEDFSNAVGEDARNATDLIAMAGAVKRDFETVAWAHEERARTCEADARSKRDLVSSVDVSGEHDAAALNTVYELAIERRAALKQQRDEADAATQRALAAKGKLEAAEHEYNGPTVEAADAAFKMAEEALAAKVDEVDAIQEQIAQLKQELAVRLSEKDTAQERVDAAHAARRAAAQHEESVAEWRQLIDEVAGVEPVDEQEWLNAENAVLTARAAVERGQRIRDALDAKRVADEYDDRAAGHRRRASEARDAAQNAAGVLCDAVARIPHCPLKVIFDDNGDARLVTPTDRSETTRFDELSDGEKWRLILPLCMGENRIVVLPQHAWGELQPAVRKELDALAREHRCTILTAVATDGPLRAVTLDGTVLSGESAGKVAVA